MAKGPRPLSEDADATINDPDIVNDREDLVINKTKQTPKQVSLGITPQFVSTAATAPNSSFNAMPASSGFNSTGTTNTSFGTAPTNFNSTTPNSGFGTIPQQPNVYQQQANADIDKSILAQQQQKENEHWMKSYWRPAMGWLYMIICGMDFVGFPLLTIFLPVIFQPFGLVVPYHTWQSLTLSNGGLIHLSFGAILGVAAFTRGQEKIAGKS
jgi:hypothetical protein